jgi:hypothetical protein
MKMVRALNSQKPGFRLIQSIACLTGAESAIFGFLPEAWAFCALFDNFLSYVDL